MGDTELDMLRDFYRYAHTWCRGQVTPPADLRTAIEAVYGELVVPITPDPAPAPAPAPETPTT